MIAQSQIQEWVRENLAGRHGDVVGFAERLLLLADETGEVRCTLATDRRLRFEILDQEPCEVELDLAKDKLRVVCAKLAVLCQESGEDVSFYGGEGVIGKKWRVRLKNTPSEQEFTITAE